MDMTWWRGEGEEELRMKNEELRMKNGVFCVQGGVGWGIEWRA